MTTLPATLKPELIHCHLKAGSKEESLRELVQILAAHEPSIVIEEILMHCFIATNTSNLGRCMDNTIWTMP